MRHVRMKVPPAVVDVRGNYGPAAMTLLDEALPRLSEHLGLSVEYVDGIRSTLKGVQPRSAQEADEAVCSVTTLKIDENLTKIRKEPITQRTSSCPPNVYHLEHAISTYCIQKLVRPFQQLLDGNCIGVDWHYETYAALGFSERYALAKAFFHLGRSLTKNTKSLKLCTVSLYLPQHGSQLPIGLGHLDLEILVQFHENYHGRSHTDNQGRDYMSEWRQNLQRLKQLKTLRLGFFLRWREDTRKHLWSGGTSYRPPARQPWRPKQPQQISTP